MFKGSCLKYITIFHIFLIVLLGNNFSDKIINIQNTITDNFQFQYLKSKEILTIQEVKDIDFTETSSNNFSLGYTNSQLWIKLNLKNNNSKSEFVLTVNEHFYEIFNLYYFDEINNKWIKKENGLFIPIENREIKTNKLATKIILQPDETKTFYIELKGKYSYFGKLLIYDSDSFYLNKQITVNIFYTFIFSIFTVILLFTLFLSIKIKEKLYFYYLGYSFFYLIYTINISGMLAYFDLHHYVYKLHSAGAFTTAFFALFSIEYLNIKKHARYFNYLLLFISFLLFILGFLLIYEYTPWNKVINNTVAIVNIALIIASIISYLKGHQFAKYYTLILVFFFIFILIFTTMVGGVTEYNILTRYGYIAASAVELIGFTLLLVNEYSVSRNKQIEYQEQLITIKTKQEELLKKEVEKRTQELEESNQKLSLLVKERELLLKEIFHRVKNNFHMILGMLWFESQKHENKEIFTELTNRIKSMSKLHEQLLYSSKDLIQININEYLKNIIENITFSYANKNFYIDYHIENIYLSFEEALNLGVIVNEILTNSIKHNQNIKENYINIFLKTIDEKIELRIEDNSKEFSIENSRGLGLNLIKEFSKKLSDSQYTYTFDKTACFTLTFRKNKN